MGNACLQIDALFGIFFACVNTFTCSVGSKEKAKDFKI